MRKRRKRSTRGSRRDAVRLASPELRALRALARVSHPGWLVSTDPSWKTVMIRLVDRRLAEKGFDKSGRPAWRITSPGRLVIAASPPPRTSSTPASASASTPAKTRKPDTRTGRKRNRTAYLAEYRKKNKTRLASWRKDYLAEPGAKAAYLASKSRYASRKRVERAARPDSPEAVRFREAERERQRRHRRRKRG